MTEFSNKVAVITGGTSGIGLATAKRFMEAGAKVIVTTRTVAGAEAGREALGNTAEVVVADASTEEGNTTLFEHIRHTRGRLDVLFLNAGVARFGPLDQLSADDFEASFRVNVLGPWLAIRSAPALMDRGGSIVLNTSVNNSIGMPGSSIYAATKAALRSLARTTSAELIGQGIRVNAVSPGPTETPIYGKLGMSAEQLQAFAKQVASQIPVGRFGRPDEIAAAVHFLASDESSFVVGAELVADGGMTQL